MRVMVIVKATKNSEAGVMPSEELLAQMGRCGVSSFCAPPTVWRMLVQADLASLRTPPQTVVGAGEPLNPEVIEQVQRAWGVTIRDGFGQTETTVQVANTPGQPVKPGSMGRATPGYVVALIDPATGSRSCAAFWPRLAGWHVLRQGDTEMPFAVLPADAGAALRAQRRRDATFALTARQVVAPEAAGDARRGPSWPWWVAWLALAALAWWLERRRPAAVPAATIA